MVGRLTSGMMRIVALGITALAACSAAGAAELREVHIDIGSSRAPLVATVHVEDYRAAPLDLLKPAAASDSQMTRFLKTYYESGRAGDTKKFASLFGPEVHADEDYYTTQTLSEEFTGLRSVRMATVLHWGEYQLGFIEVEADTGRRRWSWAHAARCFGETCQISGHFENGRLGRTVAGAFAERGVVPVSVPPQGETLLPILPAVADTAQKSAATDPIVLHLNHASEQTTLAVRTVVGSHASGNVSSVYSLGPDVCVAVLASDKDHAVRLLPLQRAGNSWTIISDPSQIEAWQVLSSSSTSQAFRNH
jgi:hypothetical protein